jgi:subtilisin-like proprotein convertase family protein
MRLLALSIAKGGRRGNPLTQFSDAATDTVDLPIPDNDPAGVERTLDLTAPGTLKTLTVSLDITHPFRGDLKVTLMLPPGQTLTVYDAPAQSGEDLRGNFPLTVPPGLPAQGTYLLKVVDRSASDTGTLNSWGLSVTSEGYVCAPWTPEAIILELLGIPTGEGDLDVNGDGRLDAADLVEWMLKNPR